METHHQTQQTQPSHRRRQSTLVYSTTKYDGSLSLDGRTAASRTVRDGAESPTSSLSQNRTLKPPTTPTNNNRNSFGIWGGSKAAASTPNLGNVSRAHSPNDFSSSSITAASASGAVTRAQGSGEGSAASIDSSGSSFHQRRKRSESIGGIKNTAGNITRIVKKSSSNFLKKFVKSFDDKDAPPTPSIPSSNNTSSVKSPPPPHGSRSTTMPELPTLSSQLREQGSRTGPLDTPPPLSPLMSQELETHFASINTALPLVDRQSQKTVQNSNVESWLKSTADNEGAILSGKHEGVSSAELSASLALLSQEPTRLDHRGSKMSDDLNSLDHDEDEDEDEDEDDDLPINISNRLSKLYESGSMHLNQSQTSLYYSTKSNLSDTEAAELASRRTSLAQDALGYSLGLSQSNSIRFSLNSIGSLHLAPLPPLSRSNSNPSSPGFPKVPVENHESKSTPRRPMSMFIPSSTSSALDSDELDDDNKGHGHQRELSVDKESTPKNLSIAGTPTQSSLNLLVPGGVREGPRIANRPITICVSADDANRIPFSSTSSIATLLTPDMSLDEQREVTLTLAIRTSKRCFEEDESFIKRGEIAEYLGTPKPFQRQVLMHYMSHFDFTGKRVDNAFRVLCQKLVLKGETQEVDRILEAFAERYVICNPRTLLGAADHAKDVVHAITYSVLLLNTDLHIVQQSNKMSRSAFIKNTLQVVQSQSLQASQNQNGRNQGEDSGSDVILEMPRSITGESLPDGLAPLPSSKRRTPSVKSWKSGQSHQSTGFVQVLNNHHQNNSSKMGSDAKANGGYGNGKWWQQELESLLKDIYVAVKQYQILLPVSPATMLSPRSKSNPTISSPPTSPTTSAFGSSIFLSNRMSRLIYPSSSSSSLPHLQDSGGGNSSYGLGHSGRRNSVSARTKQLRSDAIQRLNAQAQSQTTSDVDYLSLSAPSSTSSNLNIRHSMVGHFMSDSSLPDLAVSNRDQNRGPVSNRDLSFLRAGGDQSQDSSTNRLSTLTMTSSQTDLSTYTSTTTPSASQNSLASLQSPALSVPGSQEDYQQQLHKKQHSHDTSFSQQAQQRYTQTQLQKDQVLQQHVHARYRMEGILWRKHLLERSDKKAQHRAWRQLLVVIDTDQGTLSMFRSDGNLPKPPPTSHGHQHHGSSPMYLSASSPMGDYEADVPLFDEIQLQHTITNILPPPGYSSSRRHVFAVQLFTGAVYLFQANSPQECEAWARTCNYWAARTSKEPLVGGVVNMEYGWGRVLEELARLEDEQEQLQQHYLAATTEGGRTTPGSDISVQSLAVSGGKPMSTNSAKSFSGTADSMARLKVAMDLQVTHPEYMTDKAPPRSGGGSDISLGIGSGRGRSASIRSGTRGSVSSGSGVSAPGFGGVMGTPATLGDSLTLFEWTAPMPTMSVSQLSEEEQMHGLRKYVSGLDADMESHQEHRSPMTRLFLPKSSNYVKAFNNWERRSRHLLKEMVKYQIYVECLEQSLQFQQQLQIELDSIKAQQGEQERLEQGFVQGQGGHEHIQEGAETNDDLEVELAELVVRDVPV